MEPPPPPFAPYTGGGDDGPPPNRKLATWSLILAVLPLCVTTIAGAVMAVVVLASRRHAGKGLAVAALVVAALWVVIVPIALVAIGIAAEDDAERDAEGTITETQEISIFDVQEGDCIRIPKGDTAYSVKAVPCDKPHEAEAYARWSLSGEEFPGDAAAARTAEAGCAQRFEKFIGLSYEKSRYELYFLHPTKQSWNFRDDRDVTCMVKRPGDRPITGTLRNARR